DHDQDDHALRPARPATTPIPRALVRFRPGAFPLWRSGGDGLVLPRTIAPSRAYVLVDEQPARVPGGPVRSPKAAGAAGIRVRLGRPLRADGAAASREAATCGRRDAERPRPRRRRPAGGVPEGVPAAAAAVRQRG